MKKRLTGLLRPTAAAFAALKKYWLEGFSGRLRSLRLIASKPLRSWKELEELVHAASEAMAGAITSLDRCSEDVRATTAALAAMRRQRETKIAELRAGLRD